VVEQVRCLGFELGDGQANSDSRVAGDGDGEGEGEGAVVVDVGRKGEADSKRPRVLVCRTDEQFEMARRCAEDAEFW